MSPPPAPTVRDCSWPAITALPRRAVINATGTWERPFWPHYPGAATFTSRQLHTADYRGAEEFRGQHVLVVGSGIGNLREAASGLGGGVMTVGFR